MERDARENVEGATLLRPSTEEFDRASEMALIDRAKLDVALLFSLDSLNDFRTNGFTLGVQELPTALAKPFLFRALSSGVRGTMNVHLLLSALLVA